MIQPQTPLSLAAGSEAHIPAGHTRVRALFERAWAGNRLLVIVSIAMLGLFAITLLGLLLDPRVIGGAPAWLKPAKFAISIAFYTWTLAWMLSFIEGRPRLLRMIAWITTAGMAVEIVIIVGQMLRGTSSHFNFSTPLDALLFNLMAVFIVVVWLMGLLVAILLLRQRLADPVLAWSLRLALFISLLGGASGFLMTMPTAAQMAALKAQQPTPIIGAHSVGVPDGGPGLPITDWSTTGGDLRIGHFVGLHALQIIPLLGWLLGLRPFRRLGQRRRVLLLWASALGYLGLFALLIWQALRGQPLLAPDGQTLAALAGLVGTYILAALAICLPARAALPAR